MVEERSLIRGGMLLDTTGPTDIYVSNGLLALAPDDVSAGEPDVEIDADGLTAIPGLIDLQVNGGWGIDLTETPAGLWDVGAELATVGVTSWLPTLVSADPSTRNAALKVLDDGPPEGWSGAEPTGWHFEGPWINPAKRGAHAETSIEPIGLPADAVGARLVTMAPEIDGALDMIGDLSRSGVTVSLGHTEASPSVVRTALAAGATMGTHLFNAMTGIDHRTPGAAAGLLDSDAWLGLIVDGHHVAPELVRIVWAAAKDRVVLVSDSMAAAGSGDGMSKLAGEYVAVSGGAARLADGTLAGSVITLFDSVRMLCAQTGCPMSDAVRCASDNPARAIGLTDRGRLDDGLRADVVLLNTDHQIVATTVAGRLVHSVDGFVDERCRWRS